MHLLKMSFRIGLTALAAVCLLPTPPSHAQEEERFTSLHGTICRVTNSVTPFLNTAGIGNPSATSTLNLDCPVPMTGRHNYLYLAARHTRVDTSGNYLGTCTHNTDTSRAPWVEVYDRNANADVFCNLHMLGDGNAVVSSWGVRSTGSQGPVQRLRFPMTVWRYIPDTARLYVQCSVPAKTSDFSYVARFGFPTCEGGWSDLP